MLSLLGKRNSETWSRLSERNGKGGGILAEERLIDVVNFASNVKRSWAAGLEVSNFTVTRRRFHTEQAQETYFQNEFLKEKVLSSSNLQFPQRNPSPKEICPPWHGNFEPPLRHSNNLSVKTEKLKESDNQGIKVQGPREFLFFGTKKNMKKQKSKQIYSRWFKPWF